MDASKISGVKHTQKNRRARKNRVKREQIVQKVVSERQGYEALHTLVFITGDLFEENSRTLARKSSGGRFVYKRPIRKTSATFF